MKRLIGILLLAGTVTAAPPFNFYAAPLEGVEGDWTIDGSLIMPNQSTGYLVKSPNSSTIQSENCAVTDVAGFNGGGTTGLFANISGGGLFASGGTSGYIQTTTDGSTYSFPTKPNSSLIRGGTYGLSRFIFVGNTGADSVTGSTSTDGATWTNFKGNFTSGSMGAVACNGTTCVLGGSTSRVQTTTNFTSFTTRTYGGPSTTISGIAWSPTLTLFASTATNDSIRTSPDGTTWTWRQSGSPSPLNAITWSTTNSIFVAVGNGGTILTSSDGLTWTPRTSGVTTDLYAVYEGNGVLVATGDSLRILTSTNGTAWTARSVTPASVSSTDLYGGSYANSIHLIAGESGRVYTSSDAITWTRAGVVAPGCVDKSAMISEYNASSVTKTFGGASVFDTINTRALAATGKIQTTDTIVSNKLRTSTIQATGSTQTFSASTVTFTGDGTGDRFQWCGGLGGCGGATGGGGFLGSGSTQAAPGEARITIGANGKHELRDSADNVIATVLGNLNRKYRVNYGLVVTGGNFRQSRQTFSDADAQVDSNASIVAQIGTMSASRALTLPTAASYGSGILNISDESGSVTGGNTIVITRSGSDLINGANTTTINAAYGARILVSDGVSKWTILSSL